MKEQTTDQISKVLSGEATPEEKAELSKALLSNDEDNLVFNKIKEYWDADVQIKDKGVYGGFDESLMRKQNSSLLHSRKATALRRLYVWAASAAATVLLFSTSYLLYQNRQTPDHLITYSTQDAAVEYVLSDGTRVRLNKNSSITVNDHFGKKYRDVKLDGEGYFWVTKDSSKPFTVDAIGTKTTVLGTSFNIKIAGSEVITTLVEGSVKFTADKCDVLMAPGEEISYDTTLSSYDFCQTDPQFNTAWVAGRFNYHNLTFAGLTAKLEKIYNLKITINDERIANRIVSASFIVEEPIREILDALGTELQFKYNISKSGDIDIMGKQL